jgi:hypothetical protein
MTNPLFQSLREESLGMEEKPLILFKQFDKEGKKPMFKNESGLCCKKG